MYGVYMYITLKGTGSPGSINTEKSHKNIMKQELIGYKIYLS